MEDCKSKIVKKHIWRGGASLSLVETWKENPVSWACMNHSVEVINTFFVIIIQVNIALSHGTSFTNFHHHLMFMLEKVTSKAGEGQ